MKVLLQDVDRVRWRQDLIEDRDRLARLLNAARRVDAVRDAKLANLKKVIEEKIRTPLNPGNCKVIIFTAFADTAQYLFDHLAPWATEMLDLNAALVTGSGRNRSTLPGLRTDMGTILSMFAPRAKERPADLAGEGEIDLLIATDCISEGQNLQDCDFLVNYDIHWNPVRIIQRFGRIDRIGSQNACIQLVNFWPNIELEEYIRLEERVSGRHGSTRHLRQGQRQLNLCPDKDFQHEVFAPAATAAFHGDAVFAGMLLQQRQREPIQPGKVLAQMFVANA